MRKSLLVMSGKGGVGKTTIAVNLSYYLSSKGSNVGILDVDIHGPNVLKMLGFDDARLEIKDGRLLPLTVSHRLKAASIAGFIDSDAAVIWRGPRKHGAIKQLSQDVDWGDLDYLVVDFPPGTGDEHLSAVQLLPDVAGAIIVSTPQSVALMDMARAIDFCSKMDIPVIGAIENMSGGVFGKGTVEKRCNEKGVRFLGRISLSEEVVHASESGKPIFESEDQDIRREFEGIAKNIVGGT